MTVLVGVIVAVLVFDVAGSGVAYGTSSNGTSPMWVAVGDSLPGGTSNGNVLYSYDGISWSKSSDSGASFSVEGSGVIYGFDYFNYGVSRVKEITPAPFYPSVPDKPIAPTVTVIGDEQVTLAWSAPGHGGSAITSYGISSEPATTLQSSTLLTKDFTGLTNGTTYTFIVRAINSVGNWSLF